MFLRIGVLFSVVITVLCSATTHALADTNADFVSNYQSCPSATTCYSVGAADGHGQISYTSDSAKQWVAQTVPSGTPELFGISCPSVSTCVAVGDNAVVIRTSNSGKTWTTHHVFNASTGSSVARLNAVSCSTTIICHAVGVDTSGNGVIFDLQQGKYWAFDTRPETSGPLSGISCPTSTTTCFASGFTLGSSNPAVVFVTRDSGTTWTKAYEYPAVTAGNADYFSLYHISCFANTCVAIGKKISVADEPSLVSRSTDGGHTWSNVTIPKGVNASGVRCSSANTCFIVGSASIIRSTDRGATWSARPLPQGTAGLGGIACAAPNTCYAFGDSVLLTTDNGLSWTLASH